MPEILKALPVPESRVPSATRTPAADWRVVEAGASFHALTVRWRQASALAATKRRLLAVNLSLPARQLCLLERGPPDRQASPPETGDSDRQAGTG